MESPSVQEILSTKAAARIVAAVVATEEMAKFLRRPSFGRLNHVGVEHAGNLYQGDENKKPAL